MSYLTKEQIEKKLKQAHAKRVKQLIKWDRKELAERLKVNNVSSLKWMPRNEVFAIANLTFNPETGTAHSYQWYAIAKVFKGQMILNDYAYSPTTTKHYSKLARLFDDLGIKFSRIKAPKGLDDTERARNESLLVNARSLVKLFHSRGSKQKELNPKVLRDFASQDIETLKLMGQGVTLAHLVDALAHAVSEREARLKRSRERALDRRIMAEQRAMGFGRLNPSMFTHPKAFKAVRCYELGNRLVRQIDGQTELLAGSPLSPYVIEQIKPLDAKIAEINILGKAFSLITVTE